MIGVNILKESVKIKKETVDILMQAAPAGLDIHDVLSCAGSIEGVKRLHHVHTWNLTDTETYFEGHIDLSSVVRASKTDPVKEKLSVFLYW